MRHHIILAQSETAPLLDEATTLTAQKQEADVRKQLLDAFGKHFIVSNEDIAILTSSAEPVDERFFAVVARVRRIHKDCEVLLGGENQRLGLEIMEASTKQLNAGYQKLYRWIQREFKGLNLEDPRIGSKIRMALRVLAERPALFQACLDLLAEAREAVLTEAFQRALTDSVSGSSGRTNDSKPIEFSAHDPLRYVGDMLAWIHSAAVSEREALEVLFVSEGNEIAKGIQAGLDSQPWSNLGDEEGSEPYSFDPQKALNDLVNRDLSGAARSLQQRVDLVIQSHDDLVTIYKIINILPFYADTFSKLIGTDSQMVKTVNEIERRAFAHFESLAQDEIAATSADSRALIPDTASLDIPDYFRHGLSQLISLMKIYASSFRASMAQIEEKTDTEVTGFTPILNILLSPLLSLARTSTSSIPTATAGSISRTIFDANISLAVEESLTPYAFTHASHLKPIKARLSSLRAELVTAQHAALVKSSGLEPQLAAIAAILNPSVPDSADSLSKSEIASSLPAPVPGDLSTLHSHPAFSSSILADASAALDSFLPSALLDALARLKTLKSVSLARLVTEEAVELFVRDFEGVEGVVVGLDMEDELDEDGEERVKLRDVFPRTSGEIRVLLS